MMNNIIEANLRRMTGYNAGDMFPLLMNESIGGNAGYWHNIPCAGANFHYDPNTGEIKYFENPQNTPQEIRTSCSISILKVAFDFNKTGKCRIIKLYVSEGITSIAKQNLEDTIIAYNKEYSF